MVCWHLKTEMVNDYELILTDDDPYFHVEVKKDGKRLKTHLLSKEDEFEDLKKEYAKK